MANPDVSLDAVLDHRIRVAFEDVLDRKLAPVLAKLAALEQAAPPALLDITAFCEMAQISPATARRWAASGQVKAIRRGRVLRFDAGSLRPPDEDQIAALAATAREGR